MDLENYETFDLPLPEDLKGQIAEEKQIEYWDIEGKRMIGRVFS
jgi:translation initiation factor 5A